MEPIKYYVRFIYWKIYGNTFIKSLKKELAGCEKVLDLGCGSNSPIKYCKISYSVGVENFNPYLLNSKNKKIHSEYIKKDVREVDFAPKSFDAVILLDVIEHLSKEDGLGLIKKMEKWARKKIIISTPNGFLSQEVDIDGNGLSKHVSGWGIPEFKKLGFKKIFGISGFKIFRGDNMDKKLRPAILWRVVSDFTQGMAYKRPEAAFGLFAVKDLIYTGNL